MITSPSVRVVNGFPFFNQSIDGVGFPSAGHLSSTVAPEGRAYTTVLSLFLFQLGGPSTIIKLQKHYAFN